MEVLSSRILLAPADFERSRRWYTDVLGLRVFREYGIDGRVTGVVLFCGGGFLELTSAAPRRPLGPIAGGGEGLPPARHDMGPRSRGQLPVTIWLQVPDVVAEHARLTATGDVTITAAPDRMPWGLIEMWLEDPDGVRLVLVEVPDGHPLRSRLGIESK